MKFRWWIAALLLVAVGSIVQSGCGESAPDLPTESVEPEAVENAAEDMEVPPP